MPTTSVTPDRGTSQKLSSKAGIQSQSLKGPTFKTQSRLWAKQD